MSGPQPAGDPSWNEDMEEDEEEDGETDDLYGSLYLRSSLGSPEGWADDPWLLDIRRALRAKAGERDREFR